MNRRKLLFAFGFIALIAGFFASGAGEWLSLAALKARHGELLAWRDAQPLTAALGFAGLYIAVTALSVPGATVLTLAAGALFGLGTGTLLVAIAATTGATLAMLVARFLLRDAIQARFGERIRALDAGIERDGAFYLFTLRLVPVVPFFLINLASGLTALPVRTYVWVSLIGMLPGTVVYVNAGTQLARVESLSGLLSPGLIASFVLLGVFPLLARRALDAWQAHQVYRPWPKPKRFDRNLIVIGAGSAGLVSAYIAAAVQAKVTLVERAEMGGDCLNRGCVPSKALLRTARFLAEQRRAPDYGIGEASARFDFAEVMARVQRVIAAVAPHDSVERYTGLGVEVLAGTARLLSPWTVAITAADGSERRLDTRAIVIATGARPFVPPIPGLEEGGYLTSDTLWALRECPQRLLVLGGGPIGCELAQAFARLGARVTQVEMLPRLLAREDADVSAHIGAVFAAEGIDVRCGHRALRCERDAGGGRVLVAEHAGTEVRLGFDAILVALGRAPVTDGLGLEALGIGLTKSRTIETDAFLQTRFPNVLVCGDVAGPYQFTHTAAHQAWYAAVNGLFGQFRRFRADYSVIPWATFTEPEIARVGLNEQEARERGIAFESSVYRLDDSDRALAESEPQGWVRVLTVPGRDRILGATIVSAHAGETIAGFVLAMRHGLGLEKLLATIHVYPTWAESGKAVAGTWKRAHAPQRLLGWVRRYHDWRRG
ncbi:MAG TPA: FAD-dependent oxidoreductase [Plasticicumulans sp.]|uniref:FAD-dependent oxidoreductase n=1 Tax=Plasticicumulans sp. TaxID=2307179 RepID=UPI002B965DAE|nr:FAD-dependent oxidoreductase [Plasticicumulans sp.]HNG49422.1 FAD-dependent oxidoreductase [Plasticicumulans sp.]HNM45160.1 FAD-dependent oxidoreductase [Plasticicumulans sp.]